MNDIYLVHHGVKGMKWGVRRYQKPDGSLTTLGKKTYYNNKGTLTKEGLKARKKAQMLRSEGRSNPAFNIGLLGAAAVLGHENYNATRNFIHQYGNVAMSRVSSMAGKRAVALAAIGAMGAVSVLEAYLLASYTTRKARYKLDSNYRNRVDAAADMKNIRKRKTTK